MTPWTVGFRWKTCVWVGRRDSPGPGFDVLPVVGVKVWVWSTSPDRSYYPRGRVDVKGSTTSQLVVGVTVNEGRRYVSFDG